MDRGMFSDWANLPKHLLDSVVENLVLPSHYMQFSLVCKSWYSVAKDNKSKHDRMTAPMLLIHSGEKDYWNIYNMATNKILDFQVRVPNKRLCGSSKGWLIYVDRNDVDKNFGVTLVNPFFRVKGRTERSNSLIRLPPLMPPGWERRLKSCENYLFKATISADPISNPEECVVMVIHMERLELAFIRLGKDTTWTYMDGSDNIVPGCRMIQEVINIEESTFYAVGYFNELLSFDVTSHQSYSKIQLIVPEDEPIIGQVKRYIFEGEGKKLFMVQRYTDFEKIGVDCYRRVTKKFRVFELNSAKGEWIEKNSLGDIAVFIGDNSSISVLPSSRSGCQSDCIYFNHDRDHIMYLLPPHDFGAYNVLEQNFLQTYPAHVEKLMKRSLQLPIWVIPTLYF